MRDHEIGLHLPHDLVPQPELLELARSEVLDHCITAGDQAQDDFAPLGRLELQPQAPLVPPMDRPPTRTALDMLPPLPAGNALPRHDPDDVGAKTTPQSRP